MRNTIFTIRRSLSILALSLIFGSCYRDLGNSVYDESIEDIQVKLAKEFRTRKPFSPTAYQITPQVTTASGKQHELEYEWYIKPNAPARGTDKGKLVGTEPVLSLKLDPTDKDNPLPDVYYIRLYVKDKTNGTLTLRNTELHLSNPFSYAWVVLHAQDGHSELGTVEYDEGHIMNTPKAYSEETGKVLLGEPMTLGVRQDSYTEGGFRKHYQSQLYVVTTDLSASGLFLPTEGFKQLAPWKGLISNAQIADFDPTDVHFGFGNYGVFVASKGNVFTNTAFGAALYKLTPDANDLPGAVYTAGLAISGQSGAGFDSASRRFVLLNAAPYGGWQDMKAADVPPTNLPISKIRTDEDNLVEPDNIPAGYRLVAMLDGYKYMAEGRMAWAAYTLYAYMIDGEQAHVYTMRGRECNVSKGRDKEAPMGQVFTFPKPANIHENTLMTTGPKYAYVLFYADGNTVYRHDLATGKSTAIYTHDTPGATVTALRMAVQGFQMFDEGEAEQRYGHPFGQTLAVGYTVGSDAGELVVLQLDNTGEITTDETKYPSIQVHKGYGPIKSIGFI